MRWTSLLGLALVIATTPVSADEKPLTRDEPEYQVNVGLVYGTLAELCKLRKNEYITEERFFERSKYYVQTWYDEEWLSDGIVFLAIQAPECMEGLHGIMKK